MNEELKELLSAFLPTFEYQMPAGVGAAITYQMYYGTDTQYESGDAITERESYRVTVWQKVENKALIKAITKALRAAGWTIDYRESLIDVDGKYYQHVYNIDKWRTIE